MSQTIQIQHSLAENSHSVAKGDITDRFIKSQKKLSKADGVNVVNEALDILSHCVSPSKKGTITHLAFGYVQSGKTLSFTTLTTLAADNGYHIVIYLTGNKNNLKTQTKKRLRKDLKMHGSVFRIIDNLDDDVQSNIQNAVECEQVLLFPILKHAQHIKRLAELFKNEWNNDIDGLGILIIDDEADQASLNTYARKNSKKLEGEIADISATYGSIIELRNSLPSHSYIQYTATPQAPLLINTKDILSPQFYTVLTPGRAYTGGKVFFREQRDNIIRVIPVEDLLEIQKKNYFIKPTSYQQALHEFFITVAIGVYLQDRENVDYLSMMIHIDGRKVTNEQYKDWVEADKKHIFKALKTDPSSLSYKKRIQPIKEAYDRIAKTAKDCPSFEDVMKVLKKVVNDSKIYLVHSGEDVDEIPWEDSTAHILIGADMLNRGFTINNLSMTYMPRRATTSTADTIEQRCRFFGYKRAYLDLCRVYLPEQSIAEFEAYVDHEENLRFLLKKYNAFDQVQTDPHFFQIPEILKPTRANVIDGTIQRSNFEGWKQLKSLTGFDYNTRLVNVLLDSYKEQWLPEKEYNTDDRNHLYADCEISDIIQFIDSWSFEGDLKNTVFKNMLKDYLEYLRESRNIKFVRIYRMAYKRTDGRKRSISKGSPTYNLQTGHDTKDISLYPGDQAIKVENYVTIQLHYIQIEDPQMGKYNGSKLYNLAVYFPEKFAKSYVSVKKN